MELRMTVHVPRRRPRPVDVVVSWCGAADTAMLRDALAGHLRMPVPGLVVGGAVLADDAPLGMPPLLDGVSVAVAPGSGSAVAGGAGDHPRPVLRLVTVGGPDAGRARGLAPPGLEVGRATSGGLTLDDPSLSRRHARVDVSADGVRVVDLGSTNGVQVDGAPAADGLPADTSSTIRLGASTVRIRRAPGPGMPVDHPGDGTAGVVPGRLVVPDLAAVVVEAPPPPTEPPRHRLPWVAALAPLPVVAVLALLMGPRLLVFAVVGPVAVLASSLADRVGGRRRHRAALARHEVATAEARERLADAVAAETTRRAVRHPGPDEVLARAEHRLPGLWGGPDDLTVRLGLGDVPSRAAWRADGVLHPGTAEHVPVTVDLAAAGCLGVVAPPETARRVVAAVVGQLVVALPPSRLALRVRGSPVGDEPAHVWPALLPHTGGPGRRTLLVVEGAPPGTDAAEEVRAVVDEGGAAIVAAATDGDLPDGCGMVLSPAGGGHWTLRGPLGSVDLVGDAVGPGWRDRLARALAPLRETGGDAALPASLGVADVDARPLTVPGVLERWSAGEGPTATVGVTAAGPYVLDLRADGPHVLVGGTTGSGKSEFLRTLVTGLALASPPDGVTLLLVDFKGGAAFGPCADLPHVVGLVTDLHAHLAGRVLASLAAELRRRERLLAEAGATDLDAYVRSGATEPLPRLVVVVDELRTLVDELPDGVRRLVRLAAQGRSLGIHLVLATQRPSGAVTPEVQANVDLRIAFRVRDRADAVGVVEDARAADIPADHPGRGLARGGDGRLTAFQVALVRPGPEPGPPRVVVRDVTRPDAAAAAAGTPAHRTSADRTAETAAVVDVVAAAHATTGRPFPRRPWLPPLPARVPAETLPADAFGLLDDPDLQRQVPLRWSAHVPLWRVVGRPRSGRTTTLVALVAAAVRSCPPDRLHVHVVAATDEHDGLATLPHVGTVARADDAETVRALVRHLAHPDENGPVHTLIVVDGWERLTELDDPRDATPLSAELLRVLRDGAGGGLVAAVAGGRDLLRSTWSALGGEVLLLGAADPLDAALLGLPPDGPVLLEAGPGRGLLAGSGLEVQVADPGPPGGLTAPGTDPGPPGERSTGPRPWRRRALPAVVRRGDLGLASDVEAPDEVEPGDHLHRDTGADDGAGLLLGVAGPTADPWHWRPDRDGRRLLVAGPPGSGRSTALAALARSAAEQRRPVARVVARPASTATAGIEDLGDAAPTLRAGTFGFAGERRGCEPENSGVKAVVAVVGPGDVDALVALRRAHPDLVVLVDDADRLDDGPLAAVLVEIADLVDRDAGALVVATTTAALRGRFRGLDVSVARHRTGLLLRPDPGDGDLLGLRRLPAPVTAAPPGRGVLVLRGEPTPVQVLAPG